MKHFIENLYENLFYIFIMNRAVLKHFVKSALLVVVFSWKLHFSRYFHFKIHETRLKNILLCRCALYFARWSFSYEYLCLTSKTLTKFTLISKYSTNYATILKRLKNYLRNKRKIKSYRIISSQFEHHICITLR